ncbi:MAG: type II toxin-antitoxin system VapC family toxin [Mariniphaga sp.]|nr:type II toxin-antitoxin system VapC family toxin [Mariniphaga sp.]
MSGKLLDTNILIYLSKKQLAFEKVASSGNKLFISVITYMEVLGYPFSNETEKHIIEELCQYLPVIELDKVIVEKVIQIKQQNKIKLPDAIIVASALVNKFVLITANVSDFSNINSDLEIINPMKKN